MQYKTCYMDINFTLCLQSTYTQVSRSYQHEDLSAVLVQHSRIGQESPLNINIRGGY